MLELSLHILDLIENSVRAGAKVIAVSVVERPEEDRLEIVVEDNGHNFPVSHEKALDPFFTTKEGKRTGLGLSLFKASVEQADGTLTLGASSLGGAAVKATMQLSHVDRVPLGDIASTISSVVCTNPEIDLRFRMRVGGREIQTRVSEVLKELKPKDRHGLEVARKLHERIKAALDEVGALQ